MMVACLFMAACSSDSGDLREWTPEDHAHPPETQVDPNRVPQKDRPDMTVGELLWQRNCARCHGTDGHGGREAKVNFGSPRSDQVGIPLVAGPADFPPS